LPRDVLRGLRPPADRGRVRLLPHGVRGAAVAAARGAGDGRRAGGLRLARRFAVVLAAGLWGWLARRASDGPLRVRHGWVEATFDSVRGPGGGQVVLEVWDGERGLARSRPAALPEARFGMGPVVMPPDGEVLATLTRDG